MHLTLQQLKLFEAVSRLGSYTRASEELHITQPAVSIQIKRLEGQLGLPLFEIVGKKVFPTAAGKSIYQASVDILTSVDELRNSVEILKGEVKGPLQLAVVTTSKYFMPHLLGSFLTKYPDVQPKLVFTNRSKVMQRLHNNEDDFVVMGQIPDNKELETYPILDNILVPVAHPNHPFANQKNIPLENFIKERILEREVGSGTRLVFDQLLHHKELELQPYMVLGSSEAIKQGVMAGLGLAVLSLHSLRLEKAANKLVVLDVEGFPFKRRWYAAHIKNKNLSLVSRTFLDYILAESHRILDIDTNITKNKS